MKKFILIILLIILPETFSFAQVTIESQVNKPKVPKIVYLTFDADMTPFMKKELDNEKISAWYSQDLVDYLEKEKVSATIFITGIFAEVYPNLIREMAKHKEIEIANHSYDHSGFENPCYGLKIIKKEKEKIEEIKKTQKILKLLTGYYPKYFRYPGLCHNLQDDTLVKKFGLILSNDGLTSGDAFNKNPDSIIKSVLSNVHDGSIIIMHLGGPNAPSTLSALKKIVKKLKGENYAFKIL